MHVARLQERVLDERLARLLGQLAGERLDLEAREQPRQLDAPCARSPTRARSASPCPASTRSCAAAISSMPPAASSSSRSSDALPNGVCSAVACTSISSPLAGHDHVHVDLGAAVLDVRQVEQRLAVDDADRHRGDRVAQRHPRQRAARRPAAGRRAVQRHVAAADRRAAGAAVGLDHVAVDPDRALAERGEVDHRPQRPADQPLDLDRAPVLLPAASRRAAFAGRSSPAASRTRTSPSRCPGRASTAAPTPRPSPCR